MSHLTFDPTAAGRTPSSGSWVQQSQRLGKVTRVAPGHIRVVSSTRLFGFVFGVAGVGLGAGAVAALLHHQPLVPVALLGVMSLLFLSVGLLPAWDRIALEIRPDSIEFERRARRSRERGMLPRQALLRVRSDRVVRQANNRSSVRYPVSLVFDAALVPEGIPATLAIREFSDETKARAEAETLARDLSLPLEDAVGRDPVVRAPEALDARIQREADPGPPPPGLGVRCAGHPAELWIASGTPSGRMLLVGMAIVSTGMSLGGLAFMAGLVGSGSIPILGLALFGGVDLAFVAALLGTAWLQQSQLSVRRGELTLRRRLGPLTVLRASIPLEQIEGVRVEPARPLGTSLAVLSDAGILRVPQLRPEAADWLRRWVASRTG